MAARTLIVWRHGRTEWNHTDRYQGQTDIGLDEVGHQQATAAADSLAQLKPVALWSSDLQRAAATARALTVRTGLAAEYDPALREIDVDDWAGLTRTEVESRFPERFERIEAGLAERRGTNGETVEEVADRVAHALQRIAEVGRPNGPSVVATHGLAARVGILKWVGLPHETWHLFGGLANCAWTVLESGRAGWRITEWNAQSLPMPVHGDDEARPRSPVR